MFAVGHLALGYLSGRASSKLFGMDVNVSYLFLFSMLPDIDLVMRRFGLEHRGPTHSLVLFCVVFFPVFLVFRKRAFPYFVALVQHSVLGDLLSEGGLQLFWPLSSDWYEIRLIGMRNMTDIIVEWSVFLVCMVLLFRFKDVLFFFQPHRSNLALLIPLAAVSFSLLALATPIAVFRSVTYHLRVPNALVIPHIAFFLLFTLGVLADLRAAANFLVKQIIP